MRLITVHVSKTREYPIAVPRVIIGSGKEADVVIDDPTVSRKHALIRRRFGRYAVTDLGSTNGTYVNGRRIEQSSIIKSGDKLSFGAAQLAVVSKFKPWRFNHNTKISALLLTLGALGFLLSTFVQNWSQLEEASVAKIRPTPQAKFTVSSVLTSTPPPVLIRAAHSGTRSPVGRIASANPSPVTVLEIVSRPSGPKPPQMSWLDRLNYYRAIAKLPPVIEDSTLSDGDLKHARYLVKNRIPADGRAHSEESTNPWFTPEGLVAATTSDLMAPCPGCEQLSPVEAIDSWITGPFHRMSILKPSLRRAGYGEYAGDGLKAHAISLGARVGQFDSPVLFPGDGSVVPLRSLMVEWPDPIAGCEGFRTPTGLPITLELGGGVSANLINHSLTEGGRETLDCAFTGSTYQNPDSTQQAWGRSILDAYGAVVIIPQEPLTPGAHYTVRVNVNSHDYVWSFSIGRP